MKPIDFELERARRALDGPEAYPGEVIETVIVGLVGDMHRAGVESAGGACGAGQSVSEDHVAHR